MRDHPPLRGPALGELIRALPLGDRDGFVDALLGIDAVPADEPLPAGAVPYLPCPIDDILAVVDGLAIAPTDRVVVLGSGLGRVALLVQLLTGAAAHGIEIQQGLVDRARAINTALGLAVTFEHANLVDVELDASIVFLYAPCNGAMLARVIDRIEQLARRRPISIAAVGLELEQTWLQPRPTASAAVALYASTFA